MYLDSDTKVALISSAPSDIPREAYLTNEMMAQAREKMNKAAGSRRMLAIPSSLRQPDWLENLDRAFALKPDSIKGYTIGDNTHKESADILGAWTMKKGLSRLRKVPKAWHQKRLRAQGVVPAVGRKAIPQLRPYVDVSDVGKAAKDWPQLNFIIYHSGFRNVGDPDGTDSAEAWAFLEKTGRCEWVTDLAEVLVKYGVTNVYGDLGQIFAASTIAQPRLAAYLVGILVKGLGADRVVWGSDAVWTGSPQWQIEGLRRLEIPGDMQKKFGLKAARRRRRPRENRNFQRNQCAPV